MTPIPWKDRGANAWIRTVKDIAGTMLACVCAGWVGAHAAVILPALEVEVPEVDRGEALVAELNCVACHTPTTTVRERLRSRQAPLLGEVAGRVQPGFLESYLIGPDRLKPGTPMPDLLHGLPQGEREAAAKELAEFLTSLVRASSSAAESAPYLVQGQGRMVYHQVGCVACHAPQEAAAAVFPGYAGGGPTDSDAQQYVLRQLSQISVPLGELRSKYRVEGLARFLTDPLAVRPSGRMPDLKLTADEAHAIAMYLGSGGTAASVATASPGLAKRGRERFAKLGCAACHELGGTHKRIATRLVAPGLGELRSDAETGCLGGGVRTGAPRYDLSDAQRGGLRAAITGRDRLDSAPNAGEQVARLMVALNCYACHGRGGRGGPSPSRADYFVTTTRSDLGDEGRLPPHLSGVGMKLRPEWLQAVLLNRGSVRPYMATRMPQFGRVNVESLASTLPEVDSAGEEQIGDGRAGADVEAGRKMVGIGGYACISCHNFGPHPSLGISVMDLTRAPVRLRWVWLHRYLLDPPSLRPGTRMPSFWPDGKASLKDVLDGDTSRQVTSIWAYLSRGGEAGWPPGLLDSPRPSPAAATGRYE